MNFRVSVARALKSHVHDDGLLVHFSLIQLRHMSSGWTDFCHLNISLKQSSNQKYVSGCLNDVYRVRYEALPFNMEIFVDYNTN